MISNLKEWFASLSQSAKAGLVGGTVAILALFIWLVVWTFASDYQVLFSDLDPQDGSAIIKELDRMKMSYQLSDGGRTVLIEKDQVYKTRLQLMSKGLNLKGAVGFEIFNDSNFGMTDFAQRINYQRALQGELTRTITALEEVQSARVHLVIPESGFMKKGDKEAKASITIAAKPGYTLSQEQVLGIQRLVAAAVPEIDPANVTILDNKGVSLTKAVAKEMDNVTTAEGKLLVKQQTEQYFTQKVVAILDKTFGPGKAIVSVDVTLNYDSLKVTREDLIGLGSKDGEPIGAPTRKKRNASKKGGGKVASHGSAAAATDSGDNSAYSEQTSDEVEYQYGKKIEQLATSPGSVKRLSVGVIVPSQLEPSTIDMLSQVIAMAVGINTSRGDALTVQPLNKVPMGQGDLTGNGANKMDSNLSTFAVPEKKEPEPAARTEKSESVLRVLLALAACFVILTVALWLVLHYRSRRGPRMSPEEREQALREIQAWLTQAPTAAQREIPV